MVIAHGTHHLIKVMSSLQMYLTSPQGNTTVTAPYNITIASNNPLTNAQPWNWNAAVTANGQVPTQQFFHVPHSKLYFSKLQHHNYVFKDLML